MDEITYATDQNNVIIITNALKKLYASIERQKSKENVSETNIKELDFLRDQCRSNNIQLSFLSCQMFYQLVENGIIPPSYALTVFMSTLQNVSSPSQNAAILEGVINLLLLDLRQRINPSASPYQCPFGLRSPQHPIIMLLHSKELNSTYLVNKIYTICNNQDKHIRQNGIEFLRPVFLYVLCNPNIMECTKPIWSCFLPQIGQTESTVDLLYEIFSWNRITTGASYLQSMVMLLEALEVLVNVNQSKAALDILVYLVSTLSTVIENGHDPKPIISCMGKILRTIPISIIGDEEAFYNFLLVNLAEVLHGISPFYLGDVIRLIKFIIESKQIVSNVVVLNMIADGLVVRLANAANLLPQQCASDAESIMKTIAERTAIGRSNSNVEPKLDLKILHARTSISRNVVNLCHKLHNSEEIDRNLLENMICNETSSKIVYPIFRALLLCDEKVVKRDLWLKIWTKLLNDIENDVNESIDMIYLVLYLLSNESDGKKQLALLQGLAAFSSVKENIPKILSVYRALSNSTSMPLKLMSIDLHTKLWVKVPRTYQFLHNVLSTGETSMSAGHVWEWNIAKTHAINEICELRPTQHGTDLVALLSNILTNRNSNADNDLSTSLALDAIVLLCNSHTVNIVSTWKALKNVFKNETRPRTVKSLCNLFGQVPLLRSPTDEYERFHNVALQHLWRYVTDFEEKSIVSAALHALKNYDYAALQLRRMPKVFRENLKIPNEYQKVIEASKNDPDQTDVLTEADVVPYIPGECWIQVLDKINQNFVDDAIELISHIIENEISQFRSGVYMLPEGRAEPNDYSQLHPQSALRAIIKFCTQSVQQQAVYSNPSLLRLHCLKCISKRFPKPIPPINCFFLVKFINDTSESEHMDEHSFELMKASLILAANQAEHSGSARDLIENYLQNFKSADRRDEDISVIMELFPQICNGVAPRILSGFLRNLLYFAFERSKSSHFEKDCLFVKLVKIVTAVCEDKCKIPENSDICVDEIVKYCNFIDPDEKFYDEYVGFVCKLPSEVIERISVPESWNLKSFTKSLKIRVAATKADKHSMSDSVSLMWLNVLIDKAVDIDLDEGDSKATELLISVIANIFQNPLNEDVVCTWLMYHLGKVQSFLTAEPTPQNDKKFIFAIDIFFLCVILQTTGKLFHSDFSQGDRNTWIGNFSEALWLISERDTWKDSIARVFEFLYHLYTSQKNVASDLLPIIRNALICCRNHSYFMQKNIWARYCGLRNI